jgi:hypothetical protein
MKKLLILLSAIAVLPFAANQAIGFAEKCETYKARVTLENLENGAKIGAFMDHAEALKESNKSNFKQGIGSGSKMQETRFPDPDLSGRSYSAATAAVATGFQVFAAA